MFIETDTHYCSLVALGEDSRPGKTAGGPLVPLPRKAERNSQWRLSPCTKSSVSTTVRDISLRTFVFT